MPTYIRVGSECVQIFGAQKKNIRILSRKRISHEPTEEGATQRGIAPTPREGVGNLTERADGSLMSFYSFPVQISDPLHIGVR